jgi:hypothetical protein
VFQKLKDMWHNDGTKMIGYASTALGAVSMIDATTVHIIENFVGPHWGHRVSAGLLVLSGIGTAYRGYKNTTVKG